MKEDDFLYFDEQLQEITPRMIPTSFGNIYSHTAGMPGQPLILVVHGSGPKNSADQYNYLLHEYLVRISYLQKFYIVAIDCPGYGRSKGSKEAVKTFPLKMFKQILETLNYKTYYAMFGHSQGGAAIFNAVHEDPTITECLVMDRPVCGSIQRFRGFLMPTLLIYDIEDDGHPIWQGKLLYKELKNTEFYTYRNSQHPFWVPDNIWDKMLGFFSRMHRQERKLHVGIQSEKKNKSYSKPKEKSKSKEGRKKKKIISLDRIQEIKKMEAKEKKLIEIEQIEKSELMSISSSDQCLSLEEKPEKIFFQQQLHQKYVEEIEKVVPGPKIQETVPDPKIQEAVQTTFQKKEQQNCQVKHIEQIEIKSIQHPLTREEIEELHKCAICHEILFRPMVTNCNHTFCNKCLMESLLINEKCPLCRGKITKKTENKELHQKIIEDLPKKEFERRENDFHKIERMMKSIVYIQIGNTSRELETKQSAFTKTKKKYIWQLFVKQPKNFQLEEVGFNINMGEPAAKPIRVRNSPYTFESRGTFSFACQIIIKPRNKEYDETKAIYRIDVQPGYHSKKIALRKKIYTKP